MKQKVEIARSEQLNLLSKPCQEKIRDPNGIINDSYQIFK